MKLFAQFRSIIPIIHQNWTYYFFRVWNMRVQQFTFFEAVNSESNVLRAQSTVVTAAGDGNPNKRIAARKKRTEYHNSTPARFLMTAKLSVSVLN